MVLISGETEPNTGASENVSEINKFSFRVSENVSEINKFKVELTLLLGCDP